MLAAVDAAADEACRLQHLQVLRDAGEGHVEGLGDVADAELVRLAEELEDPAAARIGQNLEDSAQVLLGGGLTFNPTIRLSI